MAELKANLQQLVECPICYEVFDRPKALPCLHTLCSACVDQTTSWSGQIKCPFCNKRFNSRDIKTDFRTQQLVDLYLTLDLEISFANLTLQDNQRALDGRGDGVERNNENVRPEIALRTMLSVTPPQYSRIKQVLRRGEDFWFVLSNGAILTHPKRNTMAAKSKILHVTEKSSVRNGVMSGLATGISTGAAFGPVPGIVAGIAVGVATHIGSLWRNSSDKIFKYKVRHICNGFQQNNFIVYCDKDTQEAPATCLLLINERCQIESTISNGGNYELPDIKDMLTNGETLYTTDGRDVQAWCKAGRADVTWHGRLLSKIRHFKTQGVQFCVDGKHGYTNDGKSVFKFTRGQELVSAHNIPSSLAGYLEFVSVVDGKILLQHRLRKTLHLLDTDKNSWQGLCIPEEDWKPIDAFLDRVTAASNSRGDVTMIALCARAGRTDCRVYTLDNSIQ